MHQVINEQLDQHSLYQKHLLFIISFFASYNISFLNRTPFILSIFQHTIDIKYN